MKAILYVGHGSRVQAGNDELRAFVEKAMEKRRDIRLQAFCFIELAEPSIEQGIEECVKKGATEIAIVPVLLLTANHAKLDIPLEIDKAKKNHPDVIFKYGRPFGIEATIIDVLKERLECAGLKKSEGQPDYDEREEATILLVGRGSSDPDANSDLVKVSRLLWEYTPVTDVEVCYLAATRPNLDEGLAKVERLQGKTVYLLPYLLFSGVLMNTLGDRVLQLNATSEKEYRLCSSLGFDDRLVEVLLARVDEVLAEEVKVNCDLCRYRMKAVYEGIETA
ncbi:sirohydrochlorin chelatase [Halalkalibacterium ligniniphilum]|uniref:sirohydrochlorin chelatase n=1 Tax=Halalkalibacterium ligniniphilum TaxID=1134413 RepID=UPI0003466FFA|nr:sirohydrochlorin chelatase [Halalkalibacterium ligniniphilum]